MQVSPSPPPPPTAELFKGFEPLTGSASIQFANGEDWEKRRKCLFPTLLGEDLKDYFPIFVDIGQVRCFKQWVHIMGLPFVH